MMAINMGGGYDGNKHGGGVYDGNKHGTGL